MCSILEGMHKTKMLWSIQGLYGIEIIKADLTEIVDFKRGVSERLQMSYTYKHSYLEEGEIRQCGML